MIKKDRKNDQSEENSLSMYIITVILGRDQNDSSEMTRDYCGGRSFDRADISPRRYAAYSRRS